MGKSICREYTNLRTPIRALLPIPTQGFEPREVNERSFEAGVTYLIAHIASLLFSGIMGLVTEPYLKTQPEESRTTLMDKDPQTCSFCDAMSD